MEQKSIRIINKSKEGVTLKVANNVQKMSWDEFNQNFVLEEDKLHCHFTDKFIETAEKTEKAISEATVAFFMMQNAKRNGDAKNEMTYSYVLGSKIEEITNLVGCTNLEAMQLVNKAINDVRSPKANLFKETPEEYRARHQKEAEDRNPHRTYQPAATQTMGDLPGMDKLKAMFNK